MTEIFNAIKNFFVVTIPSFAETHWAVLELSFAVLMLLFFITTIWVAVRKRKMKKRLLADKATLTENLDEKTKAFEAKEQEYHELYTAYDDLCKLNNEINLERTQQTERIETLERQVHDSNNHLEAANRQLEEDAEKLAKNAGIIDDLSRSNSEYKERIETLETELAIAKDTSDEEIQNLNTIIDAKSSAYEEEKNNSENHIKKLEGIIEAYEFEIADLKSENEKLKTYEVENAVLLKALRKFKEEDETPIQETLKRFEKKLDEMSEKDTPVKRGPLESLKRRDLSETAKKLGIKNFATWTNEELKAEIIKRRKR